MKTFLLVLGFIALVYIFNILTGSIGYVYNTTDNQLFDFSNFKPSYEDATQVAESLR